MTEIQVLRHAYSAYSFVNNLFYSMTEIQVLRQFKRICVLYKVVSFIL